MTEREIFIENVATECKKYAKNYNIYVISPIIAQAILESGWGKSILATKYHNYFGLKCGKYWKGKSVSKNTFEEYEKGVLTPISDNFRIFDTFAEGIKGYFDFINTKRYSNLKEIANARQYVETIKNDGYATSSTYVDKIMKIIQDNNLTKYDDFANRHFPKPSIIYAIQVEGGNWLSSVTDKTDYAGIKNRKVIGFACKLSNNEKITYRCHIIENEKFPLKGRWLPWVNNYNLSDYYNGYAGNGKIIDGIEIKCNSHEIMYRSSSVNEYNYYPAVSSKTCDGSESYCGVFGKPLDTIQVWVK